MVLREWARDDRAEAADVRAALHHVTDDPTSVTDAEWVTLLGAADADLEELCLLADTARREDVDADALTFVVNRNLDTSIVAALPALGGPTLEDLVAEAWDLGATEICMQGPVPAHAPADTGLRMIERIHETAPGLHLHAFRAPEIRDLAARMRIGIGEYLTRARAAGLGSIPGTAAQILDDNVRAHLAGVPAPPVAEWVEVIEAAHGVGLFSTATMLYGHVETAAHQVAHLRTLIGIQSRTKGFSELILMPMLTPAVPDHLRAQVRGTATVRESRALHAVARLMTRGTFDHLQVAWTKHDPTTVVSLLNGGADDLGGLLLDGELMPTAGAESGRVLTVDDVSDIAGRVGRRPRQRTTGYDEPTADRRIDIPDVSGTTSAVGR